MAKPVRGIYIGRAYLQPFNGGEPIMLLERSCGYDYTTPELRAKSAVDKDRVTCEVRAAINSVDAINSGFDEETLMHLHNNRVEFQYIEDVEEV